MKILIMSDYPSPHLVELFSEYEKSKLYKFDFVFSAMQNKDRKWETESIEFDYKLLNAKYIDIGTYRFKFSFEYLKVIYKNRYDYVIFYDAYFQPITILAALILIIKQRKWGFFLEPRFKTKKRNSLELISQKIVQSYLCKASFILTTGKQAVNYWQSQLKNSISIYNLPYYRKLDKFLKLKNHNINKDTIISFLYVGRFIDLKRVDVAVKSAISLLNEGYKLELVLVGEGPLLQEIKDSIPNKYKSNIKFYGNISYKKTVEAYQNAHIFVFPSTDDGWGMVIPEALASGLPCISTFGVNSAVDFVTNGYNGFLCHENDEKEIKRSMKFFLDNKDKIKYFSMNAKESIREYTPMNGAEKLIHILMSEK